MTPQRSRHFDSPGKRPARRVATLLLVAGLAASVCDPGADYCVVPGTVQTPLGPVTVQVSAADVVTVDLAPAVPGTLVTGFPSPSRPVRQGCQGTRAPASPRPADW